mmetsp:Transcript_11163/g.34436  ORF Transcript_11163/g.34436 Transcript_11163/m.34436 type:complete len:202 (+) Transcript_11163:707-1312(+)
MKRECRALGVNDSAAFSAGAHSSETRSQCERRWPSVSGMSITFVNLGNAVLNPFSEPCSKLGGKIAPADAIPLGAGVEEEGGAPLRPEGGGALSFSLGFLTLGDGGGGGIPSTRIGFVSTVNGGGGEGVGLGRLPVEAASRVGGPGSRETLTFGDCANFEASTPKVLLSFSIPITSCARSFAVSRRMFSSWILRVRTSSIR